MEAESSKENKKRTAEDCEIEDHGKEKKIKVDDGSGTDTLVDHDGGNGDRNKEQRISEPAEAETKQLKQAENGDDLQGKVKQEDGDLTQTTKSDNDLPSMPKKKKCVLLLSYSGSGYHGMQRNPGVRTIEEDLTNALYKANAISEDALRNFGKMSFQRCARTDKGVSAARQVVSLKMKHMVPSKELLPEINKHLEPQIRVFDLKKVTRGFDCKSRCSSRTYEYLIPTYAFSPSYAHTTTKFRITEEIRKEINNALSMYEGTKNFHNFTSGKGFAEESSKRYIIKFEIAGEPFTENGMEFLVLQVEGQSFMQHQIRKMIGLLIAIIRKCTGVDAIKRSFEQPKMDIPKAPGLGLILDEVHFKSYNKRYGNDKLHEKLEWSNCEKEIAEFKREFIYSKIIETEVTNKSTMRWLRSLSTHSYSSAGMSGLAADKDKVKEEVKVSLDNVIDAVAVEEKSDEPATNSAGMSGLAADKDKVKEEVKVSLDNVIDAVAVEEKSDEPATK